MKAKEKAVAAAMALAGGDPKLGAIVLKEAEAKVIRRFVMQQTGATSYWLDVAAELKP